MGVQNIPGNLKKVLRTEEQLLEVLKSCEGDEIEKQSVTEQGKIQPETNCF